MVGRSVWLNIESLLHLMKLDDSSAWMDPMSDKSV